MDTLTFASPILLRHLTFSEAKRMPISEIQLSQALEELQMDMDQVCQLLETSGLADMVQFIELCILLGCDYLEPTKGIGPKTALKLIRDHGGLGGVVKFVRGKMAEKSEENASIVGEVGDEIPSDRESEEGDGGTMMNSDGEEVPTSPKKKVSTPAKSPKKKKVTSAGMQIPEYWPWEEAKELFLKPDVVKGDDLDVGSVCHLALGMLISLFSARLEDTGCRGACGVFMSG